MMQTVELSPQSSVAELLNRWPHAIKVFLKHRMSCPGCSMSTFETLEDATRIYRVDLAQIMDELKVAITRPEQTAGSQPDSENQIVPPNEESPMSETPYTFFPVIAEAIETIPTESIVSRTIYKDEGLKSIVFAFAPGQELSEHTASVPAIVHILEGECELTLGPDRYEVSAGAWARMPAKLPHSIVARTPVKMLLLMLS